MGDKPEDQLHPNWVALATVKFKPKLFVKSSGTEDFGTKKDSPAKIIEIDESARQIYDEILQLPSTACKNNEVKKTKERKRRRIVKEKFDKEVLFKFAIQNDAEGIRKLMGRSEEPNINATDAFGWTALMMAACEGAESSFEILLNFGADLSVADKKHNTAVTLANKKGFNEILNIVERQSMSIEISDDESDDGTQFCSDCGIEISKSTSKSHETSTVHLFSCKFKGNDKIKAFGIARSNRGFQMMRRTGWDGNSALGAKQNGKLYPIRTVIRKRNTGLGIEQDPAKVTHFKANDTSAVHFRPPPRALTKREIHENDLREKRHEQRLRRDLS